MQQQLPGTEQVLGTFECGHERTHRVPSERVRVFIWSTGYVAYCECGGHDLDTAADLPHVLGDHVVLLGGENLDPDLWLALDELADGWWTDPEGGTSFGKDSYRERREAFREGLDDG